MSDFIDLRSDTVTKPTAEMRRAMADAVVGDDVYREDPTVNRLEELAAEKLCKEAALFVPSGTMGNQIALRLHAAIGTSVLCTEGSHVHTVELGAAARNAGVGWWSVPDGDGTISPSDVASTAEAAERHLPPVSMVWIENTHMASGGHPWPADAVSKTATAAREADLRVHCDGARLFNAAVATATPAAELVTDVDTVMFCLSKALGAPVGSMLAGDAETMATARRFRSELGGGMRQAGVIAAAGIISLERMIDGLAADHARARRLAAALADRWPGSVDPEDVSTNIVIADARRLPDKLLGRLAQAGILAGGLGPETLRFVTHHDVDDAGIARVIEVLDEIAGETGKADDAMSTYRGLSGPDGI